MMKEYYAPRTIIPSFDHDISINPAALLSRFAKSRHAAYAPSCVRKKARSFECPALLPLRIHGLAATYATRTENTAIDKIDTMPPSPMNWTRTRSFQLGFRKCEDEETHCCRNPIIRRKLPCHHYRVRHKTNKLKKHRTEREDLM